MNNAIYQTIFSKLEIFLPSDWEKVVFYAAYTEGSYSMKYHVKSGNKMVSCFDLPGVDDRQLMKLFIDINKELSKERKTLSEKETWSVMTMIVDAEGNLKTDFDYEDISENSIEYERKWKKKYL